MKEEGNQLDFEARIYDPRTGRFLTIDPLARNYPSSTPYGFAASNPIYLIDGKGKCPIIPMVLKGATGAVISATMQFAINYIVAGNASDAFNNINWWQVTADGAQSILPWNPPGGKWGKAAVTASLVIGANALNGNYSNLNEVETLEAVTKDFLVTYLVSVGTHVALEKLGPQIPKISQWLAEKGLSPKTVKSVTGFWGSANSKLEADVANYLDGLIEGTVEDVGRMTKLQTPRGTLTQEIDVVTKKANIEIKEGTSVKAKQLNEFDKKVER